MKKKFILGLFIWLIAVLFFLYECFLRVFPNTLSQDIIKSFNINAEQFALITSSFFISYAIMQTPVGILVQKYGIKKPLTIACGLCTFSVFLFTYSDTISLAILSRFIMGVGSSFAYISLLSLALNWFPRKHFGFFAGISQFLGSIGPLLAGAPLAIAVNKFSGNWNGVFFYVGVFGIFITLLTLFFVKNKPTNESPVIYLDVSKSLRKQTYNLLKSSQILWIIIYTAVIYAAIPIIGAFWGTIYLQTKGFDKTTAAFLSACIWIGYSIGCPLIGKISDHMNRRVPLMVFSAFCGFIFSILLLYYPSNNSIFLAICFIGVGLGASGQVLSFAITTEIVPEKLQTTFLGLNNTILMLSGAAISTFISTIIHVKGASDNITYKTADFTKGLSAIPILFLVAFFISLFSIKETFCKSQFKVHHLNTKD